LGSRIREYGKGQEIDGKRKKLEERWILGGAVYAVDHETEKVILYAAA
jgi:hypothetical protein